MAGEEILGRGKLIVEVEQKVERDLKKAENAWQRSMDRMSRMEAELSVKDEKFVKKVRTAQAELKKFQEQKAEAKIGADTSDLDRGIKNAKARLRSYEKSNVGMYNRLADLDDKRAAATEKYHAAQEKASRELANARIKDEQAAAAAAKKAEDEKARATAKAERERARAAKAAAAERAKADRDAARAAVQAARTRAAEENKAARATAKEWKNMEREAHSLNNELDRQAEILQRDRDNVASLERQYASMGSKIDVLIQKRKRLFSAAERNMLTLQINEANEKLGQLGDRLDAVDGRKIRINVDESGSASMGGLLNKITEASVRLGPFTTSIAGAFQALTVLAPVLVSVAGTLGALTGSLGAATLGAGGLAAALMGGMIPALAGIVYTVRPIVEEFKTASSAQNAYQKEVLKSGENSKAAKEKLKEYQAILSRMSPAAQQAVKSLGRLRTAWQEGVTEHVTPNIENIIKGGIGMFEKLLPAIQGPMRGIFGTLDRELNGMFDRIGGTGGQNILGNLMDNFNEALGPMLRGLTNIGAATGKWLSMFSNHLPGIMSTFEAWSSRVDASANDTGRLRDRVQKLVDSAKSVGSFFMAAGRALKTFFGAGVDPGNRLLDDMADKLNELAQRPTGGLTDFFKDSISMTKQLWEAIAPLAKLFFEWATIMSFFAGKLLPVAEALGDVVEAAMSFGPVKTMIQGAFALFLTGVLAAKVIAVATAFKTLGLVASAAITRAGAAGAAGGLMRTVGTFMAARTGITAATQGFKRAGTAAAGAGGQMTMFGTGATKAADGAAKGAKGVGMMGKAASGARTALGAVSKVGRFFGPVGLAVSAASLAASFGLGKLLDKSTALPDAIAAANQAFSTFKGTLAAMPGLQLQAAQSTLDLRRAEQSTADAQKEVNRLRRAGKQGTTEYKNAVLNLQQAHLNETAAMDQQKAAAKEQAAARKQATESAQKNLDEVRKQYEALKKDHANTFERQSFDAFVAGAEKAGKSVREMLDDADLPAGHFRDKMYELAAALEKVERGENHVKEATRQAALSMLNQARAAKGLPAIASNAARSFEKLQQTLGSKGKTVKFATRFDTGGAAKKAANLANSISSKYKGGAKFVVRAVAETKTAEGLMRRLNAFKFGTKSMPVTTKGKDKLLRDLQQITGVKIPKKDVPVTEKGKAKLIRELQEIARVKFGIKDVPVKPKGNVAVRNELGNIDRIPFRDKTVNILGNRRPFDAVKDGLAIGQAIGDMFVNIKARKVRLTGGLAGLFNWNQGGGAAVVSAADGRTRMSSKDRLVQRAASAAEMRSPGKVIGQRVNQATLLVGEEKYPEYVIATNPQYRARNTKFLARAASDFGLRLTNDGGEPVTSAAGGTDGGKKLTPAQRRARAKAKRRAAAKRKATLTDPGIASGGLGAAAALPVPSQLPGDEVLGGASLEDAQNQRNSYYNAFFARARRIDSLNLRRAKARKKYDDNNPVGIKGEGKTAKAREADKKRKVASAKANRAAALRELEAINTDLTRARDGWREAKSPMDRLAWKGQNEDSIQGRWAVAESNLNKLNSYLGTIKSTEALIETERQKMERYSTEYGQTHDPGRRDTLRTDWITAKTERIRLIKALKLLYEDAAKASPAGSTLAEEWRGLAENTETALTTQQFEQAPTSETVEPSLDNWLARYNEPTNATKTGTEMVRDLAALATEAKIATVRDEGNLSGSLKDDYEAAVATREFWERAYATSKTDGTNAAVRSEIGESLVAAMEAERGLRTEREGAAAGGANAAMLADTERANIMRSYGSNYGGSTGGAGGPGGYGLQQNAASRLSPAYGGSDSTYPMGGGTSVFASSLGSAGASRTLSGSGVGSNLSPGSAAASGAPVASGGGTNLTVNNTYAAPPPDPHTQSKTMLWELGTMV